MAWIVDFSLFHLGFFTAVEVLGLGSRPGRAIQDTGAGRYGDALLELLPLLVLTLAFFLGWVAYRVTTTALWGSSVGRRIAGVRVVDADDGRSPPGWAKSWGRWGIPQAFGLVPLPGIGGLAYLWAARDRHRRGLHDLAVGTVVIRARPPRTRRRHPPG